MAGDWLKIECNTPDKPEVHEIAAALEMTPEEAFGRCFRIWRWFDQQTETGEIRVTLSSLDRHAGVTGFAQAMVDVGWLSTGENGVVAVPNFTRHNGKSAKTRALSSSRSAKYRHARVTKTSRSERDENVTREEKRRDIKPRGSEPKNGSAWWKTEAGIEARGRELNLPARPGESWAAYKDRLFKYAASQQPPIQPAPTHARATPTVENSTLENSTPAPAAPKGRFDDEDAEEGRSSI